MTRRGRQASKQAPWRIRVLTTGRLALSIVVLSILGAIYLAVNAKVARAGREVLVLEARRAELRRANADLQAELAEITSPERMLERASSLGYRPAEADEIDYVVVEGRLDRESFVAPSPPGAVETGESMLSPAYTETLGDWLKRWLYGGGLNDGR